MKTILLLFFSGFISSGFAGPFTGLSYQRVENGFNPVISNTGIVPINYANPISPLKLASFSAIHNVEVVDLKWTTDAEKEVSHFVIEKSLDGINYTDAGIVFAMGNTTEKIHYALTDKNINTSQAGVIYYRLRSISMDGKSELSQVRSIRIGQQTSKELSILTYPNPVSTELLVTIPAGWQGKKVSYEIVNSKGQVAFNNLVGTASQTEVLSVANLNPGLYILKASCSGETAQQKIFKK